MIVGVEAPSEAKPGNTVHIKVDFLSLYPADYRSCVQTHGAWTGKKGKVACGDWYWTGLMETRRFDITHPMWQEPIRDHIWIEAPGSSPVVVAETWVEIRLVAAAPAGTIINFPTPPPATAAPCDRIYYTVRFRADHAYGSIDYRSCVQTHER